MADNPEIEFFYDCSSPWTYFAFTRMSALADELQLPVRWRPILVGGVFNAVNQEVYGQREKLFAGEGSKRKMDYFFKDLQDWAKLRGVVAKMPPGHPISAEKAMRGAFYAEEQALLLPYSQAVFETYWGGENPAINDDEVLSSICTEVGLDQEGFFNAINDQQYKDLLRANTDELIERGGFGSPTIFINGDDMYFGNDRMPLVEYQLRDC